MIPAGQKDSNLCDEKWFSCLTESIYKHLSSPHKKVKFTHAQRTQNPSSQKTQSISNAHAAPPIIQEVNLNLQDVRAEIETITSKWKSLALALGLEYTKVMEIDSGRRSPADC